MTGADRAGTPRFWVPESRYTAGRVVGFAIACLFGCTTGHARYPTDWGSSSSPGSSVDAAAPAQCPDLQGRYGDDGTLAPDTPRELCESAHFTEFRTIGDWFCETSLGQNIAGTRPHGSWVELQQPDRDILVITFGEPALDPVTLRRSSGDFDCTAEGLTRTLRASTFSLGSDEGQENTATRTYNTFATITNVFLASGGMQTLERSYSRADDGSLVMAVRRQSKGLIIGLPFSKDFSTWVKWEPEPGCEDTATGASGEQPGN